MEWSDNATGDLLTFCYKCAGMVVPSNLTFPFAAVQYCARGSLHDVLIRAGRSKVPDPTNPQQLAYLPFILLLKATQLLTVALARQHCCCAVHSAVEACEGQPNVNIPAFQNTC